MATWDPATYLQFSDERSRPFFDPDLPHRCDRPELRRRPGLRSRDLTATLADRWPAARIEGVDSSPEMIDEANTHHDTRVDFQLADLVTWRPDAPVDVMVSNATLQWVPGHRDLLPRLVEMLSPNGWLAFQVPGNFTEPSHQLLRELATDARFVEATRDVEYPAAFDAETYLADLAMLGCEVDAWRRRTCTC